MVLPNIEDDQEREGTYEASGEITQYRLPVRVVGRVLWAMTNRQTRSLARDARDAMGTVPTPPQILGLDHVPAKGACLVTCNHYTRPGFGAWWTALSISAAISTRRSEAAPADIHWVMTSAWRYPEGDWRRHSVAPLTRWAFARAAKVYGFITMPPMPPSPDEVTERASAVLRTVRLAHQLAAEGGLLGLAPVGRDTPELLGGPPAGAGDFIALLVASGLPILPVGLAENDGRLRISFGALFVPEIPRQRAERDRHVARQVMHAIAAQLP
jgi:hypothetical protein